MPGSVKQSASLVQNGPQRCRTLEFSALRFKDNNFFCGFVEFAQCSNEFLDCRSGFDVSV